MVEASSTQSIEYLLKINEENGPVEEEIRSMIEK
jgi:hypothetical protein